MHGLIPYAGLKLRRNFSSNQPHETCLARHPFLALHTLHSPCHGGECNTQSYRSVTHSLTGLSPGPDGPLTDTTLSFQDERTASNGFEPPALSFFRCEQESHRAAATLVRDTSHFVAFR
jgi:hypothetical protein